MREITPERKQSTTTSGVSAPTDDKQWGGWFCVLAALVIILAAVLRFISIARYEVWLDESYCFAVARKSIPAILSDLACDNGPPLYYVMLHYWMKAFGDSAAALRSLSTVFSVATVAVVLGWKTPWFSRKARLLAGFALAITPLAIYYAQEARMYAPVAFFVLLSIVFLEKALRSGGFAAWALFALATTLSLHTSYAAFFVLPTGYMAIAAAYLASRDKAALKRHLAGILAAHAAAGALFAPWLPTFMKQPSSAAVRWIGPMWKNEPHRFLIPVKSVSVMTTGGAYYPPYLRNLGLDPARISYTRDSVAQGKEKRAFVKVIAGIPPWIPVTGMVMLVLLTLVTVLRKGSGGFSWRAFWGPCALSVLFVRYLNVVASVPILLLGAFAGAWIVLVLLVPLRRIDCGFPWRTLLMSWALLAFMVPYVASFRTPLFVPGRYDLTACVGYTVLSGIALFRMPRKWMACVLAVMAMLSLYTFGYMQSWAGKAKFSPKAKSLAAVVSKGDVVIGTSYEYGQAYYHVGPIRDELVWMAFPRENAKHFAWLDFDRWLQPGWEGEESQPVPKMALWYEAGDAIREAARRAGPGGTIAILWPGNPPVWERAINTTLEIAARSMLQSGTLIEDMQASSLELGIWVLRLPPQAK